MTHLVAGFFTVLVTLNGATVELKTGERLDGAFRQASATEVVIETAGQSITIPLDKVQAIYFGEAKVKPSGPTMSQDAMDALRGLRSVSQSGLAYRDYAPRVLDAKVKVDKYTSSATDGATGRSAIALAMREYELASKVWGATNNIAAQMNVGKAIVDDTDVVRCPAMQERIAVVQGILSKHRAMRNDPQMLWAELAQNDAVNPLWLCAAAQVAEAERLLAK